MTLIITRNNINNYTQCNKEIHAMALIITRNNYIITRNDINNYSQ